ncbi:glycosyltransferase [Pelistega sp. NLN82]|uniref:Glycosyltransferase n=1 Tax=Pelistega ratti TaxID=2652177 RepID=A0A6L9Y6S4_9BURK|nr:glycosyltransferase family 2 protein [Pelistega ratti]NEN76016.1 glycosyltransferase [Pelistega ratti]
MLKKPTICAVVVTFNRKALLLNCLNALKQQTYFLNHIVVIDNASTDGTADFLHENKWINNEFFTFISLPENSGGAGGFYEGIKYATEQGFDYIWLMDDDGLPSPNCLEKLMPYANQNNYIGPLVLDIKQPDQLCFPIRLPGSLVRLNKLDDISSQRTLNLIHGIVIPFNGILLSAQVVKKVGLPKKEYFIWGDDMEYTARMKKYGVDIATVVDAKFYHPKEASLGTPMLFNKLHFNDTSSMIKLYCMCRNNISNHRIYNTFIHEIAFSFKIIWFYLFTKPNLTKLKVAITGIWHGLKGDFTHHKKYLK